MIDPIQGNTVEKDYQILIELNFMNIYTVIYSKVKRINKNIIKTFNWLVLENEFEISLFTKEMKPKKKKRKYDRYDIGHHTIECLQIEKKKEIHHDVSNLFVSVFKKYFLC